ncbi:MULTISPECIES: sugar kinase [Pedobacter]|uniref:PfkB domain protein n=1 Tax=Pedobacter heparinus (strain ATCC 13125 / DSM 2366 / CIP 104194 / JCM 7457 / NBRC 12017 / NCIMB 9290 / NRRL B-14731 / HIM 762-3) TaxID=485917 RepID=C6XY50_PEDHD|nr:MULTISPECIES: sugar kinase [Pedobacter]ACU04468.1 PfkB domain protein [Pedobacter heparinus DSM 2366]MBB5437676.1 2-dehydro-3-deoxygluconokinase [Pedobacter sp. AK017]
MLNQENILVFGELLLRFSSSEDQFISKNHTVSLFPGGSEANVSASLGQWNIPCSYVSCVPDNALANNALQTLQELGVDTGRTVLQGSRLGLYFLLSANGLTNGEVVYDRKYSSFSNLKPGTIDWDQVLEGHTWFHWTALTPALNENMAAVCEEALKVARRKGLKISVDLNYRSRLWDYGKQPIEVMPDLVKYCDVIMGNIWAVNKMLGIPVDEHLNRQTPPEIYKTHADVSAAAVFSNFPQCRHIAYTFRFMDNPKHNLFYGTYHTPDGNYISPVLETNEVLDRIGSGDAFMAGLIYGLSTTNDGQEIINKATASGYKKLFVKGDFGDGAI